MHSLLSLLQSAFQNATEKAFPGSLAGQEPVEITQSTRETFGHYQYNGAMKLGGELKQPPRNIAERIVACLDPNDPIIEKTEIAGPGFVNITLRKGYLTEALNELLRDPRSGIPLSEHPQKLIIDFSSPNVAKEMHAGHLRSTIIGDCLARLFEFLGYETVRLNHIGDWGTAFGMLIAYMKEETPDVLTGRQPTDLSELMRLYKLSKKRFDEDPEFKNRSRLEVVSLQRGEADSKQAWETICRISREAYEEIYRLLDTTLVERGESFYNPYLADIVRDLEEKGLVEISEGAKCIFLEGYRNREGERLPLMIQKSDGGYNYDTTDMAAIHHRIKIEKADRLIYVTDAGQSGHFRMIFDAAEKAGYLDRGKVRVDHVPFGLVLGPDGKKFRTRSGETEKLIDLIDTAIRKAKAILDERNPEIDEEERTRLAEVIGIGALKYADLSNHRMSDYTFSYDRMLRFEGNTAAFLLYAYVRIEGIKRKVGIDPVTLFASDAVRLEHPSEIGLGLHLLRFHETLEATANDLLPHRLSDYLYQLTEKFNAFFRDCRVEGTSEQSSRLLLCEATGKVLKQGLHILGLKTVERM